MARGVRFPSLLALAGIGLAGSLALTSARGCTCAEPMPSTMVWDGSGYVTAWAAPEDGRSSVYVHRFLESDFGDGLVQTASSPADRSPTRVLREQALGGPPEIAVGERGFLVFARTQGERLLVVALDEHLKVGRGGKKKQIAENVEVICPAPGGHGTSYAAAWIERSEDARTLRLAFLSPAGELIESIDRRVGAGSCAMGANQRAVGLVYREAGEGRLSFHLVNSGGAREPSSQPILSTTPASKPLRLIPTDAGWLLLIGEGTSEATLVTLDENGRERESITLRNIDPQSVDIGANRGGAFATWIAARRSIIIKLAADGSETRRFEYPTARDPLGTRAVGHGSHCASTWTSDVGRYVTVLRATTCD